jgi:hypothetical protein
MAQAAAAKNLRPDRALWIRERVASGGSAIEFVGLEPVADPGSPTRAVLLRHALPVSVPAAHRMLFETVQRRPGHAYGGAAQSLNPVLRQEAAALRGLLGRALADVAPLGDAAASASTQGTAILPSWALARVAAGGAIFGSGPNGGLFNSASRAVGAVQVGVERLEQHTDFHLCGLTDALLGATYPYPSLLVPQLCCLAALLRALGARRAEYLPEVCATHAVLVDPHYWVQGRSERVLRAVAADSGGVEPPQQVFARPHQAVDRFNPNATDFALTTIAASHAASDPDDEYGFQI